ncbi:MAG: TonB-dependent receptor plug domain-containing protein, partial [Duncaniella sp.]|nr:TonB-dependent receptor plug domain-containing protein [Duncaniella sp.]
MNAVQSGSPISGGVISAGNQAVASQQFIKGTVVDETGEPMVGVTVMAEGKAAEGTSTDLDGNFSLKASTGTTLTFSYIGYETVTAKAAPGMTVTMKSSSVELDEVVAIGYGTIKKRDLTGAVSSVKAEDIVRTPTGNVIEAIQGQVAGLDITRTNGEAGSGVNMTLRGARSINGDNNPLFIIDGIEGNYEELNPNDIASIEVLKGASSTAIYGSAGANGVIIITTKNPQKDRFTINFDGYYGWNTISEFPEMNTGQRYIDFRREAQRTAGVWNSPADDDKLFPSYM